MATSLGEGIGLQSGNRSNYWMGRLASEGQQRQAQKKKDEDELAKMSDFPIDYNELLPVYGKAVAGVWKGMVNDIASMRQNGGYTRGAVVDRVQKAKQDMATYYISNSEAKRLISEKGIKKRPEVIQALTSNESTFDDLSQLNDGNFYQIGKNGEFSWKAVPETNIPVKYDANTDFNETESPTKTVFDGQRKWEVNRGIGENSILREGMALATNPIFQQQILHDNPEVLSLPIEKQVEFINQKADATARGQAPMGFKKEKWEPIDKPASGASTESERKTPLITQSTGAIMVDVPQYEKDSTGKMVEKSGTQAQRQAASYDRIVNIGDVKPVTVTVTSEMVSMNPKLKDIKSINVRPTTIYRVRGENGYQLLTRGVVMSMEDEKGIELSFGDDTGSGKIQKSFEPIFDYSAVQSEVEKTYRGKMESIYEQLEIGKSPAKNQGTTSTTLTGGNVR